jgi:hypothetical protein
MPNEDIPAMYEAGGAPDPDPGPDPDPLPFFSALCHMQK